MENMHDSDVPMFSIYGKKMGKVVNAYDGDTVHVIVQLDDKIVKLNARIIGIDTPEMKLPKDCKNREEMKLQAIKARNYLVSQVTNCSLDIDQPYSKKEMDEIFKTNTKMVEMDFYDFDKYGRSLIDIEGISKKMIAGGYAKSYDGGTK